MPGRPTPPVLLRRARDRVDAAIRWRAAETVDPVQRRADELHRRLDDVQRTADWTANELRRLAPQVAAIESRLADLDDRLRHGEPAPAGTDAEQLMLASITAEHARVRTRLAAISSYEERLRRLER